MEDRKLYIIGNGSDRHHRILSGYEHFKKFMQRHDPDLLKVVEHYLPAGEDWGDLELALAKLDVDSIIVMIFAVCLLLVGVASLACLIPARRAFAIDPLTALRCE